MPILGHHRMTLQRGDLEDPVSLAIENCGAVVISLVAQFLRPFSRQRLLANLGERLSPGGCLILIEKTVQRNAAINAAFIACYHDFKRDNGYSESEIARKREALENRLIPSAPRKISPCCSRPALEKPRSSSLGSIFKDIWRLGC